MLAIYYNKGVAAANIGELAAIEQTQNAARSTEDRARVERLESWGEEYHFN